MWLINPGSGQSPKVKSAAELYFFIIILNSWINVALFPSQLLLFFHISDRIFHLVPLNPFLDSLPKSIDTLAIITAVGPNVRLILPGDLSLSFLSSLIMFSDSLATVQKYRCSFSPTCNEIPVCLQPACQPASQRHLSAIPAPPIKGWHIQLSRYCLSQPDWPLLVSLGRKVVTAADLFTGVSAGTAEIIFSGLRVWEQPQGLVLVEVNDG